MRKLPFSIAVPIVQAPMANANDHRLAIAVANAGGLGSIPSAMLAAGVLREQVAAFRAAAPGKPLNLNFFCHVPPADPPAVHAAWKARLLPYYRELGLDPEAPLPPVPARSPFDDTACAVVEEVRPEVVSFHFGLPARPLLDRVKATGACVMSSATTVAEAVWLAAHGADVVVAQGAEAGGHRGSFLEGDAGNQIGTLALVPQVVDAIAVPVIAAGGIADGRGIVAALALGASAAQLGTAYVRCPEASSTPLHRAAVARARDDSTRITNVLTGRPARAFANRVVRELGPLAADAPAFPGAALPFIPLRMAAEPTGNSELSPLLMGQAAALAREEPAGELTARLAREAAAILQALR